MVCGLCVSAGGSCRKHVNHARGMAAVIGLDEGPTREVCAEAGVVLANLNCPVNLSFPVRRKRSARRANWPKPGAREKPALAVAGAYHSPLMHSAQAKLASVLAQVALQPPAAPVISNVTATPHEGIESIRAGWLSR